MLLYRLYIYIILFSTFLLTTFYWKWSFRFFQCLFGFWVFLDKSDFLRAVAFLFLQLSTDCCTASTRHFYRKTGSSEKEG